MTKLHGLFTGNRDSLSLKEGQSTVNEWMKLWNEWMFLFLLLNSDFHNVNDDYDAVDDELIVTFTRIAEEKKRNSFYFYVNLFFST